MREQMETGHNSGSGAIRVLGVDPGTMTTGFGMVAFSRNRLTLELSGAIRNKASSSPSEKLKHIHHELVKILRKHKPSEFAIESAFYGKNAQSALKLGQARGVLLLAAAEHSLPVAEYSPREIKKAVTGNGNATKEQIQFMIRSLLAIDERVMALDTSDALATAICHIHRLKSGGDQSSTSWKSFVAAHPERIIP
ncbi:MAG: crossover junction endodeoxyribonuclease RuvC [Ignavibacteria bacterium]|nr:crossover junction endodeoxyribonuclease RuvC [Ignavibacteria bacterium]